MRTRQTITISLPPEMADRVETTMRAEHRTRSELMREALRTYSSSRRIPEEVPTAAELRPIPRGEAAIERGDYITLDELRRHVGNWRIFFRLDVAQKVLYVLSIERRTSTTYQDFTVSSTSRRGACATFRPPRRRRSICRARP